MKVLIFLFALLTNFAFGQSLPNILVEQNGTSELYEFRGSNQQYVKTAWKNEPISTVQQKFRLENLIAGYTPNSFTTSTGNTKNVTYSISAVFETAEYIFTISDSTKLRWYNKTSLNVYRIIQGEPGDTVQEMHMGMHMGDTILAAVTQSHITIINIPQLSISDEVKISGVSDVWFTNQSQKDLTIPTPNFPSVYNGPDTIHSLGQIWNGLFWKKDMQTEHVRYANTKYLKSMEDYFQQNFFYEEIVTPPPIMSYDERYIDKVESLGFIAHFDNGDDYGAGYIWKIDSEKGMLLYSMGRQIGGVPDIYDQKTLSVFEENGKWYGFRTRDHNLFGSKAEKTDLSTMEPIGKAQGYGSRQVQLCGSNNSLAINTDGFFAYTNKDSIEYFHRLPQITYQNGNYIAGVKQSEATFRPDGGNCAWDGNYSSVQWADIAHENSADAAIVDSLGQYYLLIESWRNARIDTAINGDSTSYNLGLIFYVVDVLNDTAIYLKGLTEKFNYQAKTVAQHDINFINNKFKDGKNYLTFWNNHQSTCDTLMGEFVVVQLSQTSLTNFDFDIIHQEAVGYSDALGSNKIKIFGADTIGIANTGTAHPDQSLLSNDFQSIIYNVTSSFEDYNVLATMRNFDVDNDSLVGYAYQIDFLPVTSIPSPKFEIKVSFSEDSSDVFVEASEYPSSGSWFWNGSNIPIDSVLSLTTPYIQNKPDSIGAWFYTSGNYPMDTTRSDWINRMASEPIDLKSLVEKALDSNLPNDTSSVSIPEKQRINLSIYPNPTNGLIHLNGFSEDQSYLVIDITGKVVRKGALHKTLDLSNIKSGMYFLKTENQVIKVLKQ